MGADIAVVYWIDFDELVIPKERLEILPILCIKSLVSDLPVVKYSICRAGSSNCSFCVVLEIFHGSSLLDVHEKLTTEYVEWEARGKRICGQPNSLPKTQSKAADVLRFRTRTRGAYKTETSSEAYTRRIIYEEPHRMVPRGTSKRRKT